MGIISGGSSGGSAPITRALYNNGGGDIVPENVATPLTWAFDTGTALLTLTDPLIPVIVTGGVYSVSGAVSKTGAMLATDYAYVELLVDGGGDNAVVFQTLHLTSNSGDPPSCALTLTRYIAAINYLRFRVTHAVVGGLNFQAQMSVQRIS